MHQFEKSIIVKQEDLDGLNHVNNVRYVQWVNDIAKMHWEERATKKMLDDYYWVVLEHHLTYKGPAILDDRILLKTYVTEAKGVRSTRIVEIQHEHSGKTLFKAESHWCLVSRKSDRPTRISPELAKLFD